MEKTELDKLLGEENGESEPSATPAGKETLDTNIQKIIDAETKKVKEALLKRLEDQKVTYEQKISSLEAKLAPLDALQPKPAEVEEEEFDINSAEGWKEHIEKKSKTAANEVLEEIEKSTFAKAEQSFLAMHPEYDEAKLESLVALAKNIGIKDRFDKDSILDSLDKAWTVENRDLLKQQARLAEQLKSQADQNILELASSGASNPVKQGQDATDATPSDLRAYREYKRAGGEMTLAQFVEVSRRV